MKILFYFLVSLLFYSSSFTQNYKQIKIYPESKETIEYIAELGIDLEHSELTKDNGLIIFVNEEEFTNISSLGIRYELLIEDWFTYYESLPKLTDMEKNQFLENSRQQFNVDGFDFGSMGGFYTYQEIIDDLDEMYSLYPNLITQKINIGTSHEGRIIYAVVISDNPNVTENEPGAGYDALIHAREPQSMATQMYFMWYLLQNYGTNPEVTYLVNNRQLYFIPCFNPDGYEYNRSTNPNGGGFWRKNRKNSGSCFGVDLNRNYTYQWGYNNSGSSPDPCSDTYRGPSAGSEPELQTVTNFIMSKNIKTHFNMHSGASAFLYPWGYIDQACPDFAIYDEYCQDMVAFNGYEFGTGAQVLGYTSNGSARDWLYGEQTIKGKIIGYTYEIGAFWPLQSQIIPIAQVNIGPLLYHAWVAGDYVSYLNANYNQPYFSAGDNVEMTVELKNKGLSTAYNISATLTSLSSYATVNSGNTTVDSIEARSSALSSTPFTFSISSSAPVEEQIKFLVRVYTGTVQMSEDTVSIIIGIPGYVFADTTNNILDLWTITSSPTTPRWEATTTSYHSAPNSYTDSRIGNYANNATVTMTLTNSINLSQYNNPKLVFWTKYDIESNWDYGQVEISTNNGSTWIPLQGNYTQPGTGSFQPNGQPVYDGVQSSWVYEEISLSAYTASQVKLRYELRTDGGVVRDGWYVDDIGIVVYTAVPVELTSFTASLSDHKVVLNWSTATELNNYGFEIEKTQGLNGKWFTAGFVNGNGNSEEVIKYTFTDKFPFTGKSYYRLKQIDYDGSYEYSEIVSVDYSGVTEYELSQNYPNPFNPVTDINYSIPNPGKVSLKVYNILGVEVAELINEYKEAGKHSVEFSTRLLKGELGSGVYFYTLNSGNFVQTRKMIVIK